MQDIKEFILAELQDILETWGEPKFHARQIFSWIYKRKAADFAEMSDLPLHLRKKLKDNFSLSSIKLKALRESGDGTRKFLLLLRDRALIEAVSIPTQKRLTVCISTQVGCKFACRFCASGLAGFRRNLSCAEMLDEVLYLRHNSLQELTHIVFMGTGEPLDNYANVLKAIRIINSSSGLHIGARRITISSAGLIPGIKRLAEELLQVELSVSLHATDDKTRSQIMPINKKYPLKDLLKASRDYIDRTGRAITFEYVLVKGLNSDLQNAVILSKILEGLNCKVNLIPVNPAQNRAIQPPKKLEILFFKDYLLKHGINVTLRRPRGEDIEAACGQLRLRYENR